MAKAVRMMACLCALMLMPVSFSAAAPYTVESLSGEDWYPSADDWTYHYIYSCPRIVCGDDDPVGLLINDTLQMILDEMRLLALPMFAESPEMTASGPVTVTEEGHVMCNNGRFFSVLTVKCEEKGSGKTWSLESDTFDVSGDYPGETLTLRGVVMVGESSEQISSAVLPVLYEAFVELQAEGVCLPGIGWEEFCENVIPTLDFYADENGSAVFYFQPSLLCEPGEDVPVFTFTPAELEALVGAMPAGEEER
ncbi:MAG: hypothetical protein IKI84_03470 [Clostridia bacterium]|nr:hypothetical protein [Clostridia bacterium]